VLWRRRRWAVRPGPRSATPTTPTPLCTPTHHTHTHTFAALGTCLRGHNQDALHAGPALCGIHVRVVLLGRGGTGGGSEGSTRVTPSSHLRGHPAVCWQGWHPDDSIRLLSLGAGARQR
jgi:hypothetical protein